jgi:hypothetical protein
LKKAAHRKLPRARSSARRSPHVQIKIRGTAQWSVLLLLFTNTARFKTLRQTCSESSNEIRSKSMGCSVAVHRSESERMDGAPRYRSIVFLLRPVRSRERGYARWVLPIPNFRQLCSYVLSMIEFDFF